MTTEYEPETQLRSLASPWPSILNSSYAGKGGRRIRWASYEEPAGSAAPHLPLGALLGGPAATRAPLAGSVAFGLCRLHNPTAAPRTVDFFGSMSGRGRLYARHEASSAGVELVYEDGLISGLADAEDRGQLLLAPGWTYLLARSEHSFDAQWSGRDPRSAHPHFPNSSESEMWVHTTRVTARQPAEWGLMLAAGA